MRSAKSKKFMPDGFDEIVFSTAETSRQVNYAVHQGRLRPIARGLYTSNATQPLEAVVRQNAWRIVAGYFPGAVVSDRTALEFKPAQDGSIFIVAKQRTVELPGLIIRARPGTGPVDGDSRWMGEELFMSSVPRAVLENLRPSRARSGPRRTLRGDELEEWLDKHTANDPGRLNVLRDAARKVAPLIDCEAQMVELDELLGTLLGTRDAPMVAARGIAREQRAPIDVARLERFEELHAYLRAHPLEPAVANEAHEPSTFAFYEAYFSNFIEGTEFTVDEAEQIVFEGVVPEQRPRDAHDIIGTYRLVADPNENRRTARDGSGFVDLIKRQHGRMLAARPDVRPGEFKVRPNQAGATVFVDPDRVEGTLREAYRRFYSTTEPGLARAAFMMFVVAEVHPFIDGNGRLARVVLNAELSAQESQRIIVSIHDRDDYMQALRGLMHNGNAAAYVSVLSSLQRTSFDTDYSSLAAARRSLEAREAFVEESRSAIFGHVLDASSTTDPL
jgi:Fic/DOC family